MVTDELINTIPTADIHELAISDHAPIRIKRHIDPKMDNSNIWRFPKYLSGNKDFIKYLNDSWVD